MNQPSVLGRRLKAFRERAGLSQRQLSIKSGVPRPTISVLESGDQTDISLSNALKLARTLNITVEQLAYDDPLHASIILAGV
jgi:transcriptional regulator with XRE-family HTH domain